MDASLNLPPRCQPIIRLPIVAKRIAEGAKYQVIHQQNWGLIAARNAGLDIAQGETPVCGLR